jgi:2-aminoadipate transaminase
MSRVSSPRSRARRPGTTPTHATTRGGSREDFAFRFAQRTRGLQPSAIREILKTTEAPDVISFAGGLPAPELFPVEGVRAAAEEVLRADGPAAMQYGVTEGYLPLRQWVCEHLDRALGLRASPDQVLVTSGSQQGLDLLGKVLIDPGDVVLVENPAYLGALQAFQAYEARIIGLPTDAEGPRIDELRRVLETSRRRPKFLYLIPNFQNPTGTSTSARRRTEIAALVADFGVPVIEDDPYGRLRFEGNDAPALTAKAGMSGGVYLGTSSKILAPGMRVAWMVVRNRGLYERLVTAKQAADLHTSSFTQRLVWQYVRHTSVLDAHIVRLRTVYARRRDVMLAALARHLPAGCEWTQPEGGLFLWVRLPDAIDTMDLLRASARQKVAFVPGQPFWIGPAVRNTLRLNFSNSTEARIEEGVRRLGLTIKAALG